MSFNNLKVEHSLTHAFKIEYKNQLPKLPFYIFFLNRNAWLSDAADSSLETFVSN